MKALTVWQPWASLIMIGAKPNEFRKWDYRTRQPKLVDQRVAIHAGARPVCPGEVMMLITELERGHGSLLQDMALPLLKRLATTYRCAGLLPMSAVLGTATLGSPFKVQHFAPDSDRVSHHLWAWPLSDIRLFDESVPFKGKQGFWDFPCETSNPVPASLGVRVLA